MRACLVVFALIVGAAPVAADSKATAVIDKLKGSNDPKALAQGLAELDAIVASTPNDATAHYSRGLVLSAMGKKEDAVTAYDRAYALDAKLGEAAYNAGVLLTDLGKASQAVAHFEQAIAANPKDVDAVYNAGQAYYNAKDFKKALARWTTAATLAPEDFQTAKKLVQAYNALGKTADAAKARVRVLELHRTSKDPEVQKLASYVFDQFDVGKFHIYASETFDTSGDLAYVYTFKVADSGDKVLGSVNLETSAVIREQGTPYILGIDKDAKHTTLTKTWKKLPTYAALKPEVTKVIRATFK